MKIILDEVNVYEFKYEEKSKIYSVTGDFSEHNQDLTAGLARDLVRQIQEKRKEAQVNLNDLIVSYIPQWPKEYEEYIKQQTLSRDLVKSREIRIEKI